METKSNSQNTQRAFIDIAENMLDALPGDILIMRPRPQQKL
jgi:hypothetical protein